MSPKVTVVLPVFNRAASVHGAIASVLDQSLRQFEVVVVDDGSTDDTAAIVESITDPRVRLIRHSRNRGASAARNTGARAGTGAYVAFLDSDDEWLPTKLERQVDMFDQCDESVALVYSGVARIFGPGKVIRQIPQKRDDLSRVLLLDNVIGETSIGMVRRSAFEAVGGFDEELPAFQDLDLWFRLVQRFAVEIVPEVLAVVTKFDDGTRISCNAAASLRARELYCQKHRALMQQHGVLHLYLRESGWWYQRRAMNRQEARRLYLESLRVKPAGAATYVLLALSYLPLSWTEHLAAISHVIRGDDRLAKRPQTLDSSTLRASAMAPQTTSKGSAVS